MVILILGLNIVNFYFFTLEQFFKTDNLWIVCEFEICTLLFVILCVNIIFLC